MFVFLPRKIRAKCQLTRTDTSGDACLEILRLFNHLSGGIAWMEGCSDENIGIYNFLLEFGVWSLLVEDDFVGVWVS